MDDAGSISQRRRRSPAAAAMATTSAQLWSLPDDSDDGYATKIGGSIVDQFVLGHDPTDVFRELVQNEFDAGGDVMAVTFRGLGRWHILSPHPVAPRGTPCTPDSPRPSRRLLH